MQPAPNTEEANRNNQRSKCWFLCLLVAGFIVIGLLHPNGPFLSVHNERQNQTFDVSRRIFREGWEAVRTPRASFSFPGYESKPYTVARIEFPFFGVLGWPFAKWFGHDYAVVRVLAIAFGVASIFFLHAILRHWLDPWPAAVGAALWTTAPLVLHFGQVPMPDILCTAGMLISFWFALKGNLPGSSAAFLFSILAKLSVIVFGLPILVALLFARKCKTPKEFIVTSILWGVAPLAGLLAWTSLEWLDPNATMTVTKVLGTRGGGHNPLHREFYVATLAPLLPYGLGPLGVIGCITAAAAHRGIERPIKWAIFFSTVVYLLAVVSTVPEPQYILPLLAWAVIAAGFGAAALLERCRKSRAWCVVLGILVVLQLVTTVVFTLDLKRSRVPDYSQIVAAAGHLPPNARVIAIYPYYGASAAVWLDHNVISFGLNHVSAFDSALPGLRQAGFTHVVLFDMKLSSWVSWKAKINSFIHGSHETASRDPSLSDYADPASPFHHYCDERFTEISSSPYVVVYSLAGPPAHLPER